MKGPFPRDGIDLAIRMGRGDWPELDATCLAVEQLVPVCSPALAGTIRTTDDLRGRTLLQVNSVAEDWAAWAALAGIGEDALDLETGPRFDNIGMLIERVIHFTRGDVLTPFDNKFFRTPGNIDVSVRVHVA